MNLPALAKLFGMCLVFGASVVPLGAAPAKPLVIYWIDVEGGAATLVVTPAGESLLVDAGSPGDRDADRIAHVARDVAGLRQIDHCIVTHWHSDHVGGVPMLAKRLPVQHFYDRGIPDAPAADVNAAQLAAYRECSQGKSVVLKPGDEIPLKLTEGQPPVKLRVLAAGGLVLGEKAGAPQIRSCEKGHSALPIDNTDNGLSVALLLNFGAFKFFDGGDLTWNTEHRLACPVNLVGEVDVFQIDHHGLDISNNPVLLAALHPRAVVVNNGPQKGNTAKTFARLKALGGLEAIFQLHRNVTTTPADNTLPEFVANDAAGCAGEFIKLSVAPTGDSYTIAIPGKGTVRTFKARDIDFE